MATHLPGKQAHVKSCRHMQAAVFQCMTSVVLDLPWWLNPRKQGQGQKPKRAPACIGAAHVAQVALAVLLQAARLAAVAPLDMGDALRDLRRESPL